MTCEPGGGPGAWPSRRTPLAASALGAGAAGRPPGGGDGAPARGSGREASETGDARPRVIRIDDHLVRPRREQPPAAAARPRTERAKRGFLWRVVDYLASDLRIRQFVDLDSRLPAADGIQHAARRHAPDARVVYVDTDPVVSLHGRASSRERAVTVLKADGADPAVLIGDLRLRGRIDFTEPVAVLMAEPPPPRLEGDAARDLVCALHEAMCPGGHIAIARTPPDPGDPCARELAATLFDPFALIEPGLADMSWWPYPDEEVTGTGVGVVAGVARRT
ncbi:hypothetical protein HDA32_003790 [Spinactinospora alkalitolerans]|uniref:S-adenosyl methyltransferase n=1 Tax=Spinactinospora alkalitolerans TaxID=687207 RepID=A0A852U3Y7_9ACTN|nr:SAM-dependent methyltransferase [Spinactinospora alkalitolerans]NYE48670.1 hypothetical protein [Spinactinospora alkalitolerans]